MAQSLFSACRSVVRNGISGTQDVGGHDIFIELYTQEDIDNNVAAIARGTATGCTFGTSDESRVVLVAGDTITIPAGFTLTPAHPKKSLVILANTLVNNGTISMTAKAPNVLPHDWYIIGKSNGFDENVVIPAYANNGVLTQTVALTGGAVEVSGINGNSGTARQCGSGGTGNGTMNHYYGDYGKIGSAGSGYAFGGGAGSAGVSSYATNSAGNFSTDVSTEYPMRGGAASLAYTWASGGVGNPVGNTVGSQNWVRSQGFGCGGRVIIFCNSFSNTGSILSNGTSAVNLGDKAFNDNDNGPRSGGASGGGAIDVFYTDLEAAGTSSASGGSGLYTGRSSSGNGGAGCVTFSLLDVGPIVKPQEKYMSKANMIYFLGELVKRINGEEG